MMRASTRRDSEVVSRSMRAVRSCATTVERLIRLELQRVGYRFELNATDLPGKPDIVFSKKRLAVFVDGDFWHGRQWKLRGFASLERQFRSVNNRDYWVAKIKSNIRRDRRVDRQLRSSGWHVIRIWESDWKRDPAKCLHRVGRFLE
jgi:DNA mismatch endonuclease (patch repair protein)